MLRVYYDNTHIAFRAERVEPPSYECSPRTCREYPQYAAAQREKLERKNDTRNNDRRRRDDKRDGNRRGGNRNFNRDAKREGGNQ